MLVNFLSGFLPSLSSFLLVLLASIFFCQLFLILYWAEKYLISKTKFIEIFLNHISSIDVGVTGYEVSDNSEEKKDV